MPHRTAAWLAGHYGTRIGWGPLIDPTLSQLKDPPKIKVSRPTLAELGDAAFEWGKASKFAIANRDSFNIEPFYEGATNMTPERPPDDPEPPDPEEPPDPDAPDTPVYHWSELGRATTLKRISNPSDPTQYVDVQVINQILFRSSDGSYVQLNLKNPPGVNL